MNGEGEGVPVCVCVCVCVCGCVGGWVELGGRGGGGVLPDSYHALLQNLLLHFP